MSEELIRKKYTKQGIVLGEYDYYDIGDTTLNQLKQYKIIRNRRYGNYLTRKPDELLVDRRNKENISVLVVVEHKSPSEFRTEKQRKSAIEQCNDVAQVLDAKMGVITDSQMFIWINPKQPSEENNYEDKTTGKERSYSLIRNEDRKDLSEPFSLQKNSDTDIQNFDDDTKNTFFLINRILTTINDINSTLKATEEVDPLNLAKSVWQDIYVNTGKDPTKCLYNVVELFIFKFLSDLKILKSPFNFETIRQMYEHDNTNKEVLGYYATTCRPKIGELFPKGKDGTTIINGTIFVNSQGNPVESQASLFNSSIKNYAEFGSLRNVKKEFKTKLFETFLKQSENKSKLGQFFTPRKVVRAIIGMSDVDKLHDGERLCDPFCGVGGFICETLHNPKRKKDFLPQNKKIISKITYKGYDKGTDADEERTIILAKANMLIYLSEVIEKNPTITKEFARVFNETFELLKESNLGTLKVKTANESHKFDLILTNPPYITSGSKSIKEELKSEGLSNEYTYGGKGVEGLALEWIMRNLKKGIGKAFVIIPDSVLNVSKNNNLRQHLFDDFFINCIISLPIKTFFNTPKKTYILGITKKEDSTQCQDFPVFTYLVSNIGETLDVNRFEIEGKSDLERAKELFNSYKGSPKTFPIDEIDNLRCKVQPIEKFKENINSHWCVDRWWTKEEKIKLGMEEKEQIFSTKEFIGRIEETKTRLDAMIKYYSNRIVPSIVVIPGLGKRNNYALNQLRTAIIKAVGADVMAEKEEEE